MEIEEPAQGGSAGRAVQGAPPRATDDSGGSRGAGLLGHLPRLDRLDVVILAVIAGLTIATEGFLAVPYFEGRIVAPALDVALHTVSLLADAAVIAFSLGRYRERRETMALFQAAAFAALAVAAAAGLGLTLGSLDVDTGTPHHVPGVEPLYALLSARLLAGMLLVFGGWVTLRGATSVHYRGVLLPAIALAVLVALVEASPAGLTSPADSVLADTLQVVGVGLFLVAAWTYRELWRRDRSIGSAWFALAMVLAAFGMLHGVLYPSVYRGYVATADLLRLAWAVAVMVAIEEDSRWSVAALRDANLSLARLRHVEVERAGLEERARLARELHDGLAQALWLAKLKTEWLTRLLGAHRDLDPEVAALSVELKSAIESGLDEARGAVAALRLSATADDSLSGLIARYINDFEDRFGVRVEFERMAGVPRLTPRVESEVLRIVQEALTNVRKHADATVVRVRGGRAGDDIVLSVSDNGRGFDLAKVDAKRFGLHTMRERANLIGGRLTIVSGPDDGTTIRLSVPVRTALETGEERA